VKEMQLDPDYAAREDIDLYHITSNGKCHCRDFGFGSTYEGTSPTPVLRGRSGHRTSIVTIEFDKILEDRDAHFAEEITKRDKLIEERDEKYNKMVEEQAKLQFTINHLYVVCGVQQPTFRVTKTEFKIIIERYYFVDNILIYITNFTHRIIIVSFLSHFKEL
jgi:5-hydroxyisourate hydrolase-like protein (transthyretin family)